MSEHSFKTTGRFDVRILCLAVLVAAALVATGCSSISVRQDYDTQADFVAYKTYAWIQQPTTAVGNARAAQQMNTLLDKRIKDAVNAQLAAKGMTLVTENPDVLVMYYTGIDNKIEVQDYGYTYPRYGYGGWYGGGQVDVYEYNEGTLIVDLIDAKSDQLVWRGTATKVIDETASAQEREANLNEVISKLFAQYPPQK
jgi:hypothetical protein